MSLPRLLPSLRKALVVAAGAGVIAGAVPGAALAGGDRPAKPAKCDPAVQVCDNGRKNG